MSDKEKESRPRSRRPSYLTGPVSPGRPVEVSQDSRTPPVPEEAAEDEIKEDKELYTWRVWLLPRRPAVSVAVVVVLLTCIGLAYWAFPQIVFVAVIAVILVNRLAPYLFPVKYVLTEETVGYRTFLARDIRSWERIFTFYDQPDGVLLSNDVRSIRGRLREGLFLYYKEGAANREEVLSVVRAKVKPPEEAMAPRNGETYKGGVGSAFRRVRRLRDKE